MNDQTPLVEVCRLLPIQVAQEFMKFDAHGQKYLVQTLRTAISSWEAQGVALDPVEFDVVVETLAVQAMGSWIAVTGLQRREHEREAHAS